MFQPDILMMESVGFKTASLSVNIIFSWRSSTGSDDGIFLNKPAYIRSVECSFDVIR